MSVLIQNTVTGYVINSISSSSATKTGIAKIVHNSYYPKSVSELRFKCPIKILNKQSLLDCRTKENLVHWYNNTKYGNLQLTKKISGKSVLNKNILIAGFCGSCVYPIDEYVNNSPIYENAENVFLVESTNDDYLKGLISKGKFPTNPNFYVIDVGICIPPFPKHGIISKMDTLDIPLFGKGNESKFVPTIFIVDKLNREFYEEELMIKE